MTLTVTQFAARALDLLPYEPPPAKRGTSIATAALCWLCGGASGAKPWPQPIAIAPTFTQHNTAKCSDSDAVCQSCAVLTRAETFQAMVTARGLPIKTWAQAGWHSYSHLVLEDGTYASPTRDEMRGIILDPPAMRWILAINTTGQKHTLFRAAVASSRNLFPVQIDEATIWCPADDLAACMADFETLCALGFSKDSILTGHYHPTQMLKAGLARWRPAEAAVAMWRARNPDVLSLVHFVARGPRYFEEIEPAQRQSTPKPPPPAGAQMELF